VRGAPPSKRGPASSLASEGFFARPNDGDVGVTGASDEVVPVDDVVLRDSLDRSSVGTVSVCRGMLGLSPLGKLIGGGLSCLTGRSVIGGVSASWWDFGGDSALITAGMVGWVVCSASEPSLMSVGSSGRLGAFICVEPRRRSNDRLTFVTLKDADRLVAGLATSSPSIGVVL
jgi:hypothetical protein